LVWQDFPCSICIFVIHDLNVSGRWLDFGGVGHHSGAAEEGMAGEGYWTAWGAPALVDWCEANYVGSAYVAYILAPPPCRSGDPE